MNLISVNNLGKAFRIYRHEWQRFASWFRIPIKPSKEHWVLRQVNFVIKPGETIGIIGQNGAGKSTLLKMITGTLQPTEGQVQVNGRIAAILELGMGFNPELTGRQNVFHAATLMGYDAESIDNAMPGIEAFAEIGEYFDQSLRTYSSGMQVRIAFAVVTAWKPDLLIVDEALAVGDIAFQQKCYAKLDELKRNNVALLLVTHDLNTIYQRCSRAIVLSEGSVLYDGDPKSAGEYYEQAMIKGSAGDPAESITEINTFKEAKVTTSQMKLEHKYIKSAYIHSAHDGVELRSIAEGEFFYITCELKNLNDLKDPHIGFKVRDSRGNIMYETNTFGLDSKLVVLDGHSKITFKLKCNLYPGTYTVEYGLAAEGYGNGLFKRVLFTDALKTSFDAIRLESSINWSGMCNMHSEAVD